MSDPQPAAEPVEADRPGSTPDSTAPVPPTTGAGAVAVAAPGTPDTPDAPDAPASVEHVGTGATGAPAPPRPAWSVGLGPFVATRVGLLLLALAGAWTARQTVVTSFSDYVDRWGRWDALLFQELATYGYDGNPTEPPDAGLPSFFPGFPALLRTVGAVVPDLTLAGLLISLVSGGVVAVSLVRLARIEGFGDAVGQRAVLYLFLAPYAVFLVAPYSESVFLALALPAWVAAREGRWVAAGLLAGMATSVRITGVFLAVALVVHYAVTVRRPRPDAVALLVPFGVVLGYFAYLHARTGSWTAWTQAQEQGFGRSFGWPWQALETSWGNALGSPLGAEYRFSFFVEILFVAVGLLLTLELLRRRRWAETVYVGLSVGALASSTFFFSVSRAALLWWPLYLLLAAASVRRPWVHAVYLALSLPVLAGATLTFTSGLWTA